ncbi:MAG TPA: glycoside hydrolase family 43 protein [Chitinophagaceae bacterium]|jgi:sucrose-6-phosphate hydrolase SacC (GH32 family)|nr:glycoside hydrolase family 43 protein [Chitinophagaceae bacterium]
MKKKIGNKILLLLVPVLLTCSCTLSKPVYLFTSFHEPATEGLRMLYSYDGYSWKDLDTVLLKPEVGNQKVMRDPSIVQGPDGTFHLVWTSSWRGDKGFGYASSKDLIHWGKEKFIPVMEHESSTVNVWAPELFYDEEGKEFVIVWASCIPGRFERGMEEDSNNHRLYFTTTKNFETFSETRLFLDPGFSVIDAVIVKRSVKDYVLVLKDNTRSERDIKVAFAKNPLGPYSNISKPFTDNFTEGPTVVKIKDDWLIYYDSYKKKIYEASSTKDFITFENITSKITIPERHKHGTIVVVRKKILKKLINKFKPQRHKVAK